MEDNPTSIPVYGPLAPVSGGERLRTRAERVRYAYSQTQLAMLLVGPVVIVVWVFLRDQVEPERISNLALALRRRHWCCAGTRPLPSYGR